MTTPTGSTVSVLIADDDPLVRRVLRMALESRGYRVDEAGTASEVVDRAGLGIDLVILDVNMPGGTVLETLGTVRARHPGLPVLVLSGESQRPVDLPVAATDFARKPIDLDDLVSRVQLLLNPATNLSP